MVNVKETFSDFQGTANQEKLSEKGEELLSEKLLKATKAVGCFSFQILNIQHSESEYFHNPSGNDVKTDLTSCKLLNQTDLSDAS